MAHFSLLDQAAEDKLHSTRLLNIEERPFKRITKRLLAPSTPIASYLTRTPTNAPLSKPETVSQNADEPISDAEPVAPPPTTLSVDQETKFVKDLSRFREDVILDFASFDSSIARIQFLFLANVKQRQTYTDEKSKIQETSDDVREDMERLKVRLEEAQHTLQVRKGYDVLAEKITKNKDLKAREEQTLNIERLRAEIEELEREGVELGGAWLERREQFQRVVDEGARLRRVVRGEPEPDSKAEDDGEDNEHENENEHENDDEEGMGGRSDAEGEVDGDENMLGVDGQGDHDGNSDTGTPRPTGDGDADDHVPTPLPGDRERGAMTPGSALDDVEASMSRPAPPVGAGEDVQMKGNIPEVRVDDMDMT